MASSYPSTASSFGFPPSKRALFSPSRWKSSDFASKGLSKKEDLVGYIVFFSEKLQGLNNPYHQMIFNIARNVDLTILVMDMSLQTDFKGNLKKPVKLRSLTINSDGLYFYNEKYGSSCTAVSYNLPFPITTLQHTALASLHRDTICGVHVHGYLKWLSDMQEANGSYVRSGVLKDESGEIRVSVWSNRLIGSLQHGGKMMMLFCNTGKFDNHLIVRTTMKSLVMKIDDEDLPNDIDLTPYFPQPNIKTIRNPSIQTALIRSPYLCNNKRCGLEFEPKENNNFPRCPYCQHKAALENLKQKKYCLVIIKIDEEDVDHKETYRAGLPKDIGKSA